jgi:periplasmic protein TonB
MMPPDDAPPMPTRPHAIPRLATAVLAGLLASCASPPPPSPPPAPPPVVPAPAPPPAPAPAPVAVEPEGKVSLAASPHEYRRDAARHLYELNGHRIYKGQLPPLLHAVGVMRVELDERGHVRTFEWMRAPRHAPAVMAEIERTVRAAAPYPRPRRMGRVFYTDTWLWDHSGHFQLDTLTEGQRSR